PRIGNDDVEIDLEAGRQLDLLEILAKLVGIISGLWNIAERRHARARRLHIAELFPVVRFGNAADQDERGNCSRIQQWMSHAIPSLFFRPLEVRSLDGDSAASL